MVSAEVTLLERQKARRRIVDVLSIGWTEVKSTFRALYVNEAELFLNFPFYDKKPMQMGMEIFIFSDGKFPFPIANTQRSQG